MHFILLLECVSYMIPIYNKYKYFIKQNLKRNEIEKKLEHINPEPWIKNFNNIWFIAIANNNCKNSE